MKFSMMILCILAGCTASDSTTGSGSGSDVMQGPAGPQGSAGPQGPVGPAGMMGLQGLTGVQGATGPSGSAGMAGAAGPAGATGPAGAGLQGPTGPQGSQGFPGSSGSSGSPGATGAQGPAGLQGVAGTSSPVLMVYDKLNNRLGILLSATPGAETYIAKGDVMTNLPDGSIVSVAPQTINQGAVYYTNNDCTGVAVSPSYNGYVPLSTYVYHGAQDRLYTADVAVTYASIVVQSYSLGLLACTVVSFGSPAHALTWVGNGNPPLSLPWHIVLQ